MVRLAHRSAEKNSRRPCIARYGNILGRLGKAISNRREMARCDRPLTHNAERADLCAYRRPGCGAYHFTARTNRRRTQLGLSLLLVARRGADFARVTARWLPGRSHILAAMAAARHRRQPGTNANDLRRPWRTPSR